MSGSINRNAYAQATFTYGRADGELGTGVVMHLRESRELWSDSAFIESTCLEYKLGYYVGVSTKLVARGEIDKRYEAKGRTAAYRICVDKTPYNNESKDTDSKRDIVEQKIWDCCKHAWTHATYLAGMPNLRTGKPRADKKAKQSAREKAARAAAKLVADGKVTQTESKPIDFEKDILALPKFESRDQVRAIALQFSRAMLRVENQCGANKLSLLGDYAPIFQEFIAKVKLVSAGVSGDAVKPTA